MSFHEILISSSINISRLCSVKDFSHQAKSDTTYLSVNCVTVFSSLCSCFTSPSSVWREGGGAVERREEGVRAENRREGGERTNRYMWVGGGA